MAQEIELKFPLNDRPAIVERLRRAGAEQLFPETFEDNIVLDRRGRAAHEGSASPASGSSAGYVLATYKGPVSFDGTDQDARGSADGSRELRAGRRRSSTRSASSPSSATRSSARSGASASAEVVLDRTPIGEYFEIEGSVETIRAVAGELGLAMDRAIRRPTRSSTGRRAGRAPTFPSTWYSIRNSFRAHERR